jgi:hypothetical protein
VITQPEALRLADALILRHGVESFEGNAADELRRLHAVNAELLEALKDLLYEYDVEVQSDQEQDIQRRSRAAIAKAEEVKP